MRSVLSVVTFVFAAVASAVSTSGNRLLVVLDDVADKSAYSQFFGDLNGEQWELQLAISVPWLID